MGRKARPFFWRDGYYTDAGGSRQFLGATRQEAMQALKRKKPQLEQQAESLETIRLKTLIDRYAEHKQQHLAPYTIRCRREFLRQAVKFFGNPPVSSITALELSRWQNFLLQEKKTNNTVNTILASLRMVLNWGIQLRLIPGPSPFVALTSLPWENRQRVMTVSEFERLYTALKSTDARDMFFICRHTSARPGEARLLTWESVDWERSLWLYHEHKTRKTQKQPAPRIIPFPPSVLELLRRRQGQPACHSRYVFFNHVTNKPFDRTYLSRALRRARKRIGLGMDGNGEHLVPYSTRHTILTAAAREGCTGPQLQLLGGWTSLTMAQRYVHLSVRDSQEVSRIAVQGLSQQEQTKDVRPPSPPSG